MNSSRNTCILCVDRNWCDFCVWCQQNKEQETYIAFVYGWIFARSRTPLSFSLKVKWVDKQSGNVYLTSKFYFACIFGTLYRRILYARDCPVHLRFNRLKNWIISVRSSLAFGPTRNVIINPCMILLQSLRFFFKLVFQTFQLSFFLLATLAILSNSPSCFK